MTVKSVKKRVLPELDDDFAADTGEAETLLELRQKLKEGLESQAEHQAGHFAENELVEQLLDMHDFDLPEAFVNRQIDNKIRQQLQQLQQQGMNPQDLDLDFESLRDGLREETEDQLRTEFVLIAIAEKEGLQVDDQDLQNYIAHQAMHSQVSPQQLAQWYQQDRNRLQQAAGSALLEKTVGFLLEKADIQEIEWPEEEEHEAKSQARREKRAARSKKADKPKKQAKTPKKEAKKEEPKAKKAGGTPATKAKTDQPAAAPNGAEAKEAFSAKTVDELKDYLRDNDLKVSGKKADLIDRLVEAGVTP